MPLVPHLSSFTGERAGWRLGGAFSGTYRFVQTEQWQAGAGLNFLQTYHDRGSLSGYNLTSVNPRLFAGTFFDLAGLPAFAAGSYDFLRDWLYGTGYSTSHTLRADLVARVLPPLQAGFFYSVAFQNYDTKGDTPTLTARDATVHSLGPSLQYSLDAAQRHRIDLGYTYTRNDAAGHNFNFDSHAVNLRVTSNLRGPVWLIGEASYATADYVQQISAPQRRQDIQTYRAILQIALSRTLTTDVSYLYTRSDAGSGQFAYDRDIVGVGLTYRY